MVVLEENLGPLPLEESPRCFVIVDGDDRAVPRGCGPIIRPERQRKRGETVPFMPVMSASIVL